jgi:hypothetical protein
VKTIAAKQEPCVRPAERVETISLGAETILFDEVSQKLFHLNVTAASIWSQLCEGRTAKQVVECVANLWSIDAQEARKVVLPMLRVWRLNGLLLGSPREPLSQRLSDGEGDEPIAVEPVRPILTDWKRRHYRMLRTAFSIGFSDSALEALVDPVLSHLSIGEPSADARIIDVVDTGREIQVIGCHRIIGRCPTRRGLAPLIHGLVGLIAIRAHPYLFAIHGSGLARPDGALILAGRSGCGKTTMAAALMAAGWDYLSDDTILLAPGTLEAVPVPYSLSIKQGSWSLLRSRFPTLGRNAVHVRSDDKLVRFLGPTQRVCTEGRAVRWVGFPHRSASGSSSIRSLDCTEGVYRLLEHCCAVPKPLKCSDVRDLMQWSTHVNFFEFAVRDLDEAVQQISDLVTGDGDAPIDPALLRLSNSFLTVTRGL